MCGQHYLSIFILGASLSQSAIAAFLDDSNVTVEFKNSYMNLNSDTATANRPHSEEWGQGIILRAQSGWHELGEVKLAADINAMTGIRLYNDNPSVYINMFPREGDGYTDNWGRLAGTFKMKYKDTLLEAGELNPKLPVISYNNGRLLPQSFLGAQITAKPFAQVDIHAGYVDRVIGRASSNWTGLSVKGATYKEKKITYSKESNQFIYSGFDWKVNPNLTSQYYFGHLDDFYNQHFIGLQHTYKFSKNNQLSTDFRYFNTRADGQNKHGVKGYGDLIDNETFSIDFNWKLHNNQFRLAYQEVSDDGPFVQMNQTDLRDDNGISEGAGGYNVYLPTSRWLEKFFNAGEKSYLLGYKYNFKDFGLKGLAFNWTYVRGTDFGDCGCLREWENDVGLDYKIQSGPLKNMLLQVQNANFRKSTGVAKDQVRINLNYTWKF